MKTELIELMRRHFLGRVKMPNLRKQLTGRPAQALLFEDGNENLLAAFIRLHELNKEYQEKLFLPKYRPFLEIYISLHPLCNAFHVRLLELNDFALSFLYLSRYPITTEATCKVIGLRNPQLIGACKCSFEEENEMSLVETRNCEMIKAYLEKHSFFDSAQGRIIHLRLFEVIAFYDERYAWCDEACATAKRLGIKLNAEFIAA